MQSPGAWLDPRNSLPRGNDKHIVWGREKEIQDHLSDRNGLCVLSNSESSYDSSQTLSSSSENVDKPKTREEKDEEWIEAVMTSTGGCNSCPRGPKRSEVANPGAELSSVDPPRSNRNKIVAATSTPMPIQSSCLPQHCGNMSSSSSSSSAVLQAAPVLGSGAKRMGLRVLMIDSMLDVHEEMSEGEEGDALDRQEDKRVDTGNALSSSSLPSSSAGAMADLVTVPEMYRDSHRHQMTDAELFTLYSMDQLSEGSQEEEEFIPPSVGSVGHPTGRCRPCHYYRTKAGCVNGQQCGFCHCKHSKRSRPRLGRPDREKCRQLAQWVFDAQKGSEWHKQFSEAQLLLFTGSNYKLAAYATTVLRSLIGGAVLRETHHLSI